MTIEARLRKLQRATEALQTQVDTLMETNARLRAAYRDLEAALLVADEARLARSTVGARVAEKLCAQLESTISTKH